MQIEAVFPQKFGTWTDYAKRYCNAHIRYDRLFSMIFYHHIFIANFKLH
jgi:hypothetical protein